MRVYLFNAEAFLVHVPQVEHGLCTVLLLGRQSVVDYRRLVVHIGAITVEMIIAQFNPRHSVTCTHTQRRQSAVFTVSLHTPVSQCRIQPHFDMEDERNAPAIRRVINQ